MAKIKYPEWKKAVWEAYRVFLPAFLAIVYAQFEAGVDLKEWKAWTFSLLSAAVVAGVKAVVKWAREKYGKGDYAKAVYKLPF